MKEQNTVPTEVLIKSIIQQCENGEISIEEAERRLAGVGLFAKFTHQEPTKEHFPQTGFLKKYEPQGAFVFLDSKEWKAFNTAKSWHENPRPTTDEYLNSIPGATAQSAHEINLSELSPNTSIVLHLPGSIENPQIETSKTSIQSLKEMIHNSFKDGESIIFKFPPKEFNYDTAVKDVEKFNKSFDRLVKYFIEKYPNATLIDPRTEKRFGFAFDMTNIPGHDAIVDIVKDEQIKSGDYEIKTYGVGKNIEGKHTDHIMVSIKDKKTAIGEEYARKIRHEFATGLKDITKEAPHDDDAATMYFKIDYKPNHPELAEAEKAWGAYKLAEKMVETHLAAENPKEAKRYLDAAVGYKNSSDRYRKSEAEAWNILTNKDSDPKQRHAMYLYLHKIMHQWPEEVCNRTPETEEMFLFFEEMQKKVKEGTAYEGGSFKKGSWHNFGTVRYDKKEKSITWHDSEMLAGAYANALKMLEYFRQGKIAAEEVVLNIWGTAPNNSQLVDKSEPTQSPEAAAQEKAEKEFHRTNRLYNLPFIIDKLKRRAVNPFALKDHNKTMDELAAALKEWSQLLKEGAE